MNKEYALERIRELETKLVETRRAAIGEIHAGLPSEGVLSRLFYQVETLKMWRMLHVHLLDNVPVALAKEKALLANVQQLTSDTSSNGLGHLGVAFALLRKEAQESFDRSVPLP